MDDLPDLPTHLQIGSDALEYISELKPIGEWESRTHCWWRLLEVTSAHSSDMVPAQTRWWLCVGKTYPFDKITFYPASEGGLEATFQHQNYNAPAKSGTDHRSGHPCLTFSTAALGKLHRQAEPTDAYERLPWHAMRLLEWLEAAATNELAQPGDYFELPDLPDKRDKRGFAFSEDSVSLEQWNGIDAKVGRAEFVSSATPAMVYVRRFLNADQVIHQPTWGVTIQQLNNVTHGMWIKLQHPLVLPPWQHPRTWAELERILQNESIALKDELQRHLHRLRQQTELPLVIGYPIPNRNGEDPKAMHWQGLILPISTKRDVPKGWRKNEHNFWRLDLQRTFKPDHEINWMTSQNLHPNEIGMRGRLPDHLRIARIAMIGAGALGSVIAETLIRAGVTDIIVVDHDTLEVKNLVRHELVMTDVGRNKAAQLVRHLNSINPNVRARAITSGFPATKTQDLQALEDTDIVLDVTANDDVLRSLEQHAWKTEKLICVLSLGWKARTLHFYSTRTTRFSARAYERAIAAEIHADRSHPDDAPREGIGCWHPVFPARHDDIQLMAMTAIKRLETINRQRQPSELIVIEQRYDSDDVFIGLHTRQARQ